MEQRKHFFAYTRRLSMHSATAACVSGLIRMDRLKSIDFSKVSLQFTSSDPKVLVLHLLLALVAVLVELARPIVDTDSDSPVHELTCSQSGKMGCNAY